MDNLFEAIDTLDFEYNPIQIVNIEMFQNIRVIKILLDGFNDERPTQTWYIDCINVKEECLSLGHTNHFKYTDDHILLWPYNELNVLLSYYGQTDKPESLITELYRQHIKLVGEEISFQKYFHGDLFELVNSKFGNFAQGPLPLIKVYAEVLDKFQIKNNISGYGYNKAGYNERTDPPLKILFWYESYIIAREFKAYRLDDEIKAEDYGGDF